MGKNVILVDWLPQEKWDFHEFLTVHAKTGWDVLGCNASKPRTGKLDKFLNVTIKYILFPLKLFLRKKEYANIIAWQQFFGLFFAFYCKLFRVKNYPKLIILTFIYKQKKGIIGWLYFRWIRSVVRSKYIDKIVCYSQPERSYYLSKLGINPEKIVFIQYGISKCEAIQTIQAEPSPKQEQYFLAVGRSNRDYRFLIDSVKETKFKVIILSDELHEPSRNNIQIYQHVFGMEYLKYLAHCTGVIIPLKDENISSGQLVFLRAMEFGKPIIVTKGQAINDYITDGQNGIVIEKEADQLVKAMEQLLDDEQLRVRLGENGRKSFNELFSMERFAGAIAALIH